MGFYDHIKTEALEKIHRTIDYFIERYEIDVTLLSRPKPTLRPSFSIGFFSTGYYVAQNAYCFVCIDDIDHDRTRAEESTHWLHLAVNQDPRIREYKIIKENGETDESLANFVECVGRYGALIYTNGNADLADELTRADNLHQKGYRQSQVLWDKYGDAYFKALLTMSLDEGIQFLEEVAHVDC